MRVVFLLGSGISVDAGMPSVRGITDQVISGDGAWHHTSDVYVLNGKNPNYELRRPMVEPILRLISDVARRTAATAHGGATTYEDLALVLQQVRDALSGEYENPTVLPFADQLLGPAGIDRDGLHELCDDALNYINDTVHELLRRGRLDDHEHLRAIVEACRNLGRVDLATLNHDLLVEAALDANSIDYADGFERTDDDVRFWTDRWHHAPVRLLKLHGSVDWFDFRRRSDPVGGPIPARYVGGDVEHPRRPDVELRSPRPTFLTGTFTKILAYQAGHFPDVHARFHEALRGADRLVVIGYGFRDKAINNRLVSWLARGSANRLIVCHDDPSKARSDARPAISRHWNAWTEADRLTTIPVFVAGLSYETLAAELTH